MVLTEFNEEVYKKGIFEEGYSQGMNQGISQGQTALAEAIKQIHAGATVDDLIKAGFDKNTAELAWTCK